MLIPNKLSLLYSPFESHIQPFGITNTLLSKSSLKLRFPLLSFETMRLVLNSKSNLLLSFSFLRNTIFYLSFILEIE